MPTHETVIDEWLPLVEQESYRLTVDGVVDEDASTIEFLVRLTPKRNDQPLFILTVRATVTNPVTLTSILLGVATIYALCVASSMTGSIGKLIYQGYEQSKKDEPDLEMRRRIYDLFRRVLGRKDEIKAEAVKALTGCLAKAVGQ